MSTSLLIGLFALCCAMAAAFAFRKERRALGWPVSIATVVEKSPQSRFEGSGSMLSFNRDSDHFLEWTVSGRTYRSQLEDRAQIVGAGFKLWRLPPSMEPQRIRYNPAHPSQHFQEAHVGHWKYLGTASAVALVAALLVRLI